MSLRRRSQCVAHLVRNEGVFFHYEVPLSSSNVTSLSVLAHDPKVKFVMVDDTADLIADVLAFFGDHSGEATPLEVDLFSVADFARWSAPARLTVPYRYKGNWEDRDGTPGGCGWQSRARSRAVTVHELGHALFYSALLPYLPEIRKNLAELHRQVLGAPSEEGNASLSQEAVAESAAQFTPCALYGASSELWADWLAATYFQNPFVIADTLHFGSAPEYLRHRALQRSLAAPPAVTESEVEDPHYRLKDVSYFLWARGGARRLNLTFLYEMRDVLIEDIRVRSRDLSLVQLDRSQLNRRLALALWRHAAKLLAN